MKKYYFFNNKKTSQFLSILNAFKRFQTHKPDLAK